MAFFKIQTQILKGLIFLIWEMALFLNFGPNWEKRDFLEKRPKSIGKMRKFKSCPWPSIFLSHIKFGKKSYFQWYPAPKMALYDQKRPKTPPKGAKNAVFQNLTPNSESSDFFDMKNGLFFQFRSKFQKTDFFGPKKHVSSLLGGFYQ